MLQPGVVDSCADNAYHRDMGYERIKTEHAGAKNGGGAWMTRAEAKQTGKRKRRQADKRTTRVMANGEPMPDVMAAVWHSRNS